MKRGKCFGNLSFRARSVGKIVLSNPALPVELDQLNIKDLAIADAVVDLTLFRHDEAIAVTVLRKVGYVEAIVRH
jgi:hypothetical protein